MGQEIVCIVILVYVAVHKNVKIAMEVVENDQTGQGYFLLRKGCDEEKKHKKDNQFLEKTD